jgi:Flp pilus assembly protein TadB
MSAFPPSTSQAHPDERGARATLGNRLLWIYPIVGVIAATALLWLIGVTLWTSLAVAFLAACPLVIVWVLLAERMQKLPQSRSSR